MQCLKATDYRNFLTSSLEIVLLASSTKEYANPSGLSLVLHVVPRDTRVHDEHGGAHNRSIMGPGKGSSLPTSRRFTGCQMGLSYFVFKKSFCHDVEQPHKKKVLPTSPATGPILAKHFESV